MMYLLYALQNANPSNKVIMNVFAVSPLRQESQPEQTQVSSVNVFSSEAAYVSSAFRRPLHHILRVQQQQLERSVSSQAGDTHHVCCYMITCYIFLSLIVPFLYKPWKHENCIVI